MAEEPVGGRRTGTGTGDAAAPSGSDAAATQPVRIPVTEVPDPEPEEDGAADEERADGPAPAGAPASDPAAETLATAGAAAATESDDEDEDGSEPEAESEAEPEPGAAAEAESAAPAAKPGGKAGFDVFAPSARPEPIPVSEAPDLEAEAADAQDTGEAEDGDAVEDDADDAAGFDAERTTVIDPALVAGGRVPVGEAPEVEADDAPEDDEDAAAVTMLVPGARRADADPDEAEGPVAPSAAEADETTLIPKVTPEKATESTTVMPSVAAPRTEMSRRPYSPAPSGYGSARQDWNSEGPDALPTRMQPRVPPQGQGGRAGGKKAARGYQPPEFHTVDPQRDELPPPQNFKLDRRELDREEEGGRHLGRRALLIGGFAAVVAAGGLAASGKVKLPGTTPTAPPTVGFAPATGSGATSSTQTGTAFLTAWQNNQLETAANITDDPAAALAALKAYRENLGVVGMVMNPNAANGVGWMTFGITTQGGSPMGQWQYESAFGTYAKEIDGFARWFVKWDPAILYASLKQGYQLKIVKTPASVKGLVDRNGAAIDPTAHPSLAGIVNDLMKSAVAVGATDGQNVIMTDADGNQLSTVTVLTPPIDNGTVKTTFDMKVQTAMESATTYRTGGMVAIEPSTGHILGISNDSSEYYDVALLAGRAPGSTFKIITSAALLHNRLTTIDTNVVCPQLNVESTILNNSEGESAYGSTYEEDFAASCNNAFSSFWNQGVTPDMLAETAQTFFGLNQPWDLGSGESAQYMVVPKNLSGALLAESLVGQGNILSCPLAMCSVAATVANGSFKQPIMIPEAKQITATPLGSTLQSNLKSLMSSVVSEGTAVGIFPADGHYFAKTGTAETGTRAHTLNDSWFVVFNDQVDLALGALGVDGGYGASLAAPQCAKVFRALGYMS